MTKCFNTVKVSQRADLSHHRGRHQMINSSKIWHQKNSTKNNLFVCLTKGPWVSFYVPNFYVTPYYFLPLVFSRHLELALLAYILHFAQSCTDPLGGFISLSFISFHLFHFAPSCTDYLAILWIVISQLKLGRSSDSTYYYYIKLVV